MTLLRIRRGMDVQVLSGMFGIAPSTVCRIFYNNMDQLFASPAKMIDFMAVIHSSEKKSPKMFKPFLKTRNVYDCTEFYIQKATLPSSKRTCDLVKVQTPQHGKSSPGNVTIGHVYVCVKLIYYHFSVRYTTTVALLLVVLH